MNRRNMIIGAVATLGLGGWYLSSTRNTTMVAFPDARLPGAANAQSTNGDVDTSGIKDMVLGNPDATVEIIEYASFTCPHCATFHQGPFKQLKSEFIDTGKVRFIHREVFFDRFGLWASLVARCGGEEKYFGIINMIYSSQSEWTRAGEPAAIVDELRKIGRLAGLENDAIEACLQDGDQAQAMVAWYQKNAEADGITSTPSFVIDGKKHANMSYADMQKIINDALAG
ncbi:DsbA family protein [Sulfitobacter sp. F26169L]|uniref:DsbA family protein n=1 Tax=Sulfitobacter sp. F26169L TaxID=2996015 RepID=UPI002260EC41|nr:DsbA family protein [Sulfitobacter sp. F26169L]MCX7565681.1 DsbA family protein [Sulfitobacter sp. F26169L]